MRFALIAVLLVCSGAQAGPLSYLKTHKQVIARDLLVTGAYIAAASTDPCVRPAPCGDQSAWWSGDHPTRRQVMRPALGISAGFVTMNHLIWYLDPDGRHKAANFATWIGAGILAGDEAWDVRSNLAWKR